MNCNTSEYFPLNFLGACLEFLAGMLKSGFIWTLVGWGNIVGKLEKVGCKCEDILCELDVGRVVGNSKLELKTRVGLLVLATGNRFDVVL